MTMKKILTTIVCLSMASFLMTSCVAKRKYVAARARATQAQNENVALNSRITGLEDSVSNLHKRIGALGNANENAANELYKTNNELNMTKDQIAAQRARLQQLQSFISTQQAATEQLRKKISDALAGFTSNELTVTMKNGRVYISLQESLLFPSGSAVVNPKGKEAVAKVASVLNTNPDINIDIEGHTDDKPIHTKMYADNWALSTARATSIAHVLIDDYQVSPAKLIASGRSSYMPVATNDSPEGRALNRRTEIILEPKYDQLMELMGGAPTATDNK
jgi:chemotaxis protein MotB